MLKTVFGFIKVMNSETEPRQISLALAFSMVAGFTPFFGLQNVLILFLVLILRVNVSAFILGLGVFSALGYLLDPLFHRIGLFVLTIAPLSGVWTAFYNTTIMRAAYFNNSVVMGSFFTAILLFVPFILAANRIILAYREHILSYVKKSRVVEAFTATRLYRAYKSYSDIRGSL